MGHDSGHGARLRQPNIPTMRHGSDSRNCHTGEMACRVIHGRGADSQPCMSTLGHDFNSHNCHTGNKAWTA
eukprot:1159014-Pelagomonas_calceolata.AAC.8